MTYFILRYKWLIVIFSLTIGIIPAFIIPDVKIDPEIRNYVPRRIPSRIETDKIEKEFGGQDMIMLLFSDSSIISTYNLIKIREIDRSISAISGVGTRISPFTVKNLYGRDGMIIAEPLINEIPFHREGLEELSKELTGNRFANGIVVSSDLTAAAITATISGSQIESETLAKIDSVLNDNPLSAVTLRGGLPYIRKFLLDDVARDAIVLVPAALIIMLLVLKVNLGSWIKVLMPFCVVLLSTMISIALIPLSGWRISIITLLLPVILISVTNNYGIYLVAGFRGWYNEEENKISEIRELTGSLYMPILFSGFTTIAGLLGLLTHSVVPAKQLGILSSTGVIIALILSLLLIPSLMVICRAKIKNDEPAGKEAKRIENLLGLVARLIVRRPERIIITSAVFISLMSAGMLLLKVNTNQEDYFSGGHPVREASALINSKFGGSQTISVMISGDIKSPEVMHGIDTLTRCIEKADGVGTVFSISQIVREMSRAIFEKGEDGYDKIPVSGDAIAQMFELYNMSGEQQDFAQLMNLNNDRAHILIRLSDPENLKIRKISALLNELAAKIPAEVTIGGYAIIMADFAKSIIVGQAVSLVFAMLIVFLLLTVIFRSVKGGLIGSVPLIASVLILFGFMGFTGIDLDAATALLSSVMIGVGVDFTIQYVWRFSLDIKRGMSCNAATIDSIKTIGRTIVVNGLSVMAGFSALILSGFTSIRFFGYLVVISIGACLAGALILIPAILVKYKPAFTGLRHINLNSSKK